MTILFSVLASMVLSHFYVRMQLEDDLTATFTEVDNELTQLDQRMSVNATHLANLEKSLRKSHYQNKQEIELIRERLRTIHETVEMIMRSLED